MHATLISNTIREVSKEQLLNFIDGFSHGVFLDSNNAIESPIPATGTKYDFIAAAGVHDEFIGNENSISQLQEFLNRQKEKGDWVFGSLSYDVKNDIENLESANQDAINFPAIHFFVPDHLIICRNGVVHYLSKSLSDHDLRKVILETKNSVNDHLVPTVHFSNVLNREEYLRQIGSVLNHIKRGDIYELNYCQQLIGEVKNFDPTQVFQKLFSISPNPFSCFLKIREKYLICSSPERFITKIGNKILSQPVKGTAARGSNLEDDEANKKQLSESAKERSENVMIVDLVRNDLSRIATKGSVNVEELFGVYSFQRVHQMISSISCELKTEVNFTDIIRATFPMGSMTGAPKVNAMKIIETTENFKRGLFSGTVGFIEPSGDFDFNVVIRSILFDSVKQIVSVAAGGAITSKSIPSKEYEESFLKLTPQLQAMGVDVTKLVASLE